jgi:hypothetical protein
MLILKPKTNCAEKFLLAGLNNVQNRYLRHQYNRATIEYQRIEGVFSHELYHQLRKIQEDNFHEVINCDNNFFRNIVLHMTLPKQRYSVPNNQCVYNLNTYRTIPDVVLHQGQNNKNKQMLVGEIKMKGVNFSLILTDLQKLIYYKVSGLKFENAVFIYSGDKSDLEEKLEVGLTSKILKCLIKNNIVVALRSKASKKTSWEVYEFDKEN